MRPDLPTLGIRFDVNRIDSGSYGIACWTIFWEAIDPAQISGSVLYEGDSAASMADRENVFCIAVQNADSGTIGAIRAALSNHDAFAAVSAPPRFIEGRDCTREPLVHVGAVTSTGDLHGDAWNSRPGLQRARPR